MTTGRASHSQFRPLLSPTVLLSLALAGRADAQALMNYRDAGETAIALQALSLSRHAQLHVIGHSLDFKTDPNRPASTRSRR